MNMFFRWIFAILIATHFSQSGYADDIVVFGASGQFGSKIVREGLDRYHKIYGVSRSPEQFEYTEDKFTAVLGNPTQLESVQEIVKNADSILVALGDREAKTPEESAMYLTAIALTTALADLGPDGPPVVVLGGGNTAAETEEEMLEILAARGGNDNPRLTQIFLSQWATYQAYKASNINWTYVATPRYILGAGNDGDTSRTGQYRESTDGSLDAEPDTGLSRADVAVAMMDFAESGDYSQMRVSIAQKDP